MTMPKVISIHAEHPIDRTSGIIHQLPDEVLVIVIFYAARHERVQGGDPRVLLRLSLVCRRWKSIVEATPSLWGSIDFDWWRGTPLVLYRSSGAVPLDNHWAQPYDLKSTAPTIAAEDIGKQTQLLASALAEISRLRHVHVVVTSQTLDREILSYLSALSESPELRSLHLGRIQTRDDWDFEVGPIKAPNLTQIYVHRIAWRFGNIDMWQVPQLRTLDLSASNWRPSLRELLDLLSATPLIQFIRLKCPSVASELETEIDTDPRIIRLDHLESFFGKSSDPASAILHLPFNLIFPPKCRLEYTIKSSFQWEQIVGTEHILFSFHAFDSTEIKPLSLFIGDISRDFGFVVTTFGPASPIGHLSITFSPGARNSSGRRWSHRLPLVHSHACDLSTLTFVKCRAPLDSSTWHAAFGSCTNLTSIWIRVDRARALASALSKPLARAPLDIFLPSLKELTIAEDASLLPKHEPSWMGVLERLENTLRGRKASHGSVLERLTLIRLDWENQADTVAQPVAWAKETEIYVPYLREVVKQLVVHGV